MLSCAPEPVSFSLSGIREGIHLLHNLRADFAQGQLVRIAVVLARVHRNRRNLLSQTGKTSSGPSPLAPARLC